MDRWSASSVGSPGTSTGCGQAFASTVANKPAIATKCRVYRSCSCLASGDSPSGGFGISGLLHPCPVTGSVVALHRRQAGALAASRSDDVFCTHFRCNSIWQSEEGGTWPSESRRGRSASQIVANLGIAGLFAAAGRYEGCVAALAEAAADTVSSEIGQATGHPARLVTTGRMVPAGTDGGVTLTGTLAGLVAAALVVMVGSGHHRAWPVQATTWMAAGAGLYFDSLLGATVERRGWMGNDLVNFTSTLFTAWIASLLM